MSDASLKSRAIETLALHHLNAVPTGTAAAAPFEARNFDATRVNGRRARTNFYLTLPSGEVRGIDAGRGAWFADGIALSGEGREARGLDLSVKAQTHKGRLPRRAAVDVGCNNAGKAVKARAERGDALIIAHVVGAAGTFPAGVEGAVVGTTVTAIRFHRIDGSISGTVPHYMTEAGVRAGAPAGATTVEDREGLKAWWRAQDGYWRLRVEIDDTNAISDWLSPAEAGEFATALAGKHGRKSVQRGGASHRLDTLRFWAGSGEVRVNGRTDEVAVLRKAIAKVLTVLMDGNWHPVSEFNSSIRVNVQKLNEALAPMGYEVQNARPSKARKVTGEHGYRLRRA